MDKNIFEVSVGKEYIEDTHIIVVYIDCYIKNSAIIQNFYKDNLRVMQKGNDIKVQIKRKISMKLYEDLLSGKRVSQFF